MSDIKTDENRGKDLTSNFSWEKRLPFIFLGFLAISIIGYFLLSNHWTIIITNHLGGLGIIGLLAYLTGFIAKRKGYNYKKVLRLSFFLPIILGFIAVIIISMRVNFFYCGGGVSLLTSLLIIMAYLLVKKRKLNNLIEEKNK